MTVAAIAEVYQEYVADGLATPRSIGFPLRDPADLVVEADGVVQTLGTDYAITGASPLQQIVPLAPVWANGVTIAYYRHTPRAQQYDIPAGVDLRAESLEAELDRMQLQQQEQDDAILRSMQVPRGQLPPGVDFSDLIDGDLLTYRDGALRRFLAAPFAGKYYVGAAGTGHPVPATAPVEGSDAALRADLAAVGGAALVAFRQAGANAKDENIEAAVRREVWADQFRLVADAHDGPCITRAVTALLAAGGGGVVRLSRRVYTLNSPITFAGLNNVRIVGAGKGGAGTMLRETFASGDAITFSACQFCEISDVYFWPTVRKTSGYSVKLTGASFACRVDIHSDFGWNALLMDGATETRWRLVSRYLLGTVGALLTGTNANRSFRAICEDQTSDNPYPANAPVTVANRKTFAGGMTLAVGDYFQANGAIWQCVQAGVAGASAPSGYPAGSSPESVFTTDIDSGTAKLRFVSNAALSHLVQDNYAYSLVIIAAALLNGARGFVMTDTANTGTSYPVWATAIDLECDHNFFAGVDLERGEGFFAPGFAWIGSCLAGNGVTIGPNFRGNVVFGDGSRVMGNAQHGFLRQAGPVDVRFDGAEATDNGTESSGIYHGLAIAPGSVDTQVNSGRFGDSVSVAGNNQGFGISIGAGSDKTSIIGANVRGNVNGAIDIGASQTALMIEACPGYNNQASPSAVTVGASPYTYTNNTGAKVSLTVTGGTVSSITLGGDQVASATGQQVIVPPGASAVITYSALPTVKAQRL